MAGSRGTQSLVPTTEHKFVVEKVCRGIKGTGPSQQGQPYYEDRLQCSECGLKIDQEVVRESLDYGLICSGTLSHGKYFFFPYADSKLQHELSSPCPGAAAKEEKDEE